MSSQINKSITFKSLTTQDTVNSNDYLVGARDDGTGNFVDFKYPVTVVGGGGTLKERITSDVDGKVISNSFFVNEISEIVTNNQTYLSDVDFTQRDGDDALTDTITFINLDLFIGQILLAKV